MTKDSRLVDHWVEIEPERMARYKEMFRWNPASRVFYEPAEVGPGMTVADFGCGPGYTAIEMAKWVGPGGTVHALDINEEFIACTVQNAAEAGLSDQITAHLLEGTVLPLADESLDRIMARNTIIYVPDPAETLSEFRRVLKPGGRAHCIEGDWTLVRCEPVPEEDWQAVLKAASWAWPRPSIGRQLYGHFRAAGYEEPELRVLTNPDSTGRLRGMMATVMSYARQSGEMAESKLDEIERMIDEALEAQTYLAIAPQFVVTATA